MPATVPLAHRHRCEVCHMSPDDTSAVQAGDPVAVILARMEVKLDNALTEQGRHASSIESLDRRVDTLEKSAAVEVDRDTPTKIEALSTRVAKVEAKWLMAAGAAATLGAGGGFGLTKILGGG